MVTSNKSTKYLQDISRSKIYMVVLPEYQGRGIGKEIIKRICEQLAVENIILYAVPGREGFYEKCGFKKKRTAMAKLNPFMSDPDSGYLE